MSRDRVYLSPPHMSPHERELLLDAFDSNWIAPLGPHVHALEREFAEKIGGGEVVALSTGTAALHLSLILLGIKPGDDVAVSTFTFAATANAVAYLGAKPVFIDCDRETWNVDPTLLAEELEDGRRRGRLPKAVIVVDLYGQCADYKRILDTCRDYHVPVIEDAAEALAPRTAACRRAVSARSPASPSTATRSSPPAAVGCSWPGAAIGPRGPASSPPRHMFLPPITSTRRSATITA